MAIDTLLTLTRREMHCLQPLLRGGRRTTIADIALKTEAGVVSVLITVRGSGSAEFESWRCIECPSVLLPERESPKVTKVTVDLTSCRQKDNALLGEPHGGVLDA